MRLSSTPIANAGLTFQMTVPPNTLSLSRDRNFTEPSTNFHDDTTKPDVNTSSTLVAFMEVHQLSKPNKNKEMPPSLTVLSHAKSRCFLLASIKTTTDTVNIVLN